VLSILRLLSAIVLFLAAIGCVTETRNEQAVGDGRPSSGAIVAETANITTSFENVSATPTGTIAISATAVTKSSHYRALVGRDAPTRVVWWDTNARQNQLSPCVGSNLVISPRGRRAACVDPWYQYPREKPHPTQPKLIDIDAPSRRHVVPWPASAAASCNMPDISCPQAAWVDENNLAIIAHDSSCPEGTGRLLIVALQSMSLKGRGTCASGVVTSDGHVGLIRHQVNTLTETFSIDGGKTWNQGNLALVDGEGNPYFWAGPPGTNGMFELRDRDGRLVLRYARVANWVNGMPSF